MAPPTITYDPAKRAKTLAERGLDFVEAGEVLATATYQVEDTRRDYAEARMICFGYLRGRLVMIGYVRRGETVHVFSMRKANAREQARFG